MSFYATKPVIVKAEEYIVGAKDVDGTFSETNFDVIVAFVGNALKVLSHHGGQFLSIETTDGWKPLVPGSFVVKNGAGNIAVMDHNTFVAQFNLIPDEDGKIAAQWKEATRES